MPTTACTVGIGRSSPGSAALAATRGLQSAVVTFDRHPASVVRPESAPKLLAISPRSSSCWPRPVLDYTLVVHFDEVRAKEAAGGLRPRGAGGVPGGASRGGRGPTSTSVTVGRATWLCSSAWAPTHGFEVVGLDLVGMDGRPASRRRRGLLDRHPPGAGAGDLPAATEMLGRPHEVRGPVVRGDGRARELGFCTANVAVPDDICLPADGIYAGWYLRPDGLVPPRRAVARSAADVLRARRFFAARGAPAGLRRRPLR